MKKANILLDGNSTGFSIIEKMDFELVDNVFDALHMAFHSDDDHENDDVDMRFMAFWNLFLCSTGWTEDEFWETWEERACHCPKCGEKGIMVDVDGNPIDTKSIEKDDADKKVN